jgi:hypothetical protein
MKPHLNTDKASALIRMAVTIELLEIKDDFWGDVIFSNFFYRAEQA